MEPSSEENKKPSMPDVLQYTNYRVFLHDYYAYKKSTSAVFSLRFFAAKAGLSSHAHLKLVMDGKTETLVSGYSNLDVYLNDIVKHLY